jgi:hypothetical protein
MRRAHPWPLRAESTTVILAHRHRHPDDALFFGAAAQHFTITEAAHPRQEGQLSDVRILLMRPIVRPPEKSQQPGSF